MNKKHYIVGAGRFGNDVRYTWEYHLSEFHGSEFSGFIDFNDDLDNVVATPTTYTSICPEVGIVFALGDGFNRVQLFNSYFKDNLDYVILLLLVGEFLCLARLTTLSFSMLYNSLLFLTLFISQVGNCLLIHARCNWS